MASDDDDLLASSAGATDATAAAGTPGWPVAAPDVAAALGAVFGARADLPALIAAATQAVEDYCNRAFAQATVTESYDGGIPRIFLRRPPVVSVAAVAINGVVVDNAAGGGWTVDPASGELARGQLLAPWSWCGLLLGGGGDPGRGGIAGGFGRPDWTMGMLDVAVTYAGGYAPVPAPVRQAALIVVKYLADATRHTGLYTSERIGDYTYQMAQGGPDDRLPPAARMLLGVYRLPRVM